MSKEIKRKKDLIAGLHSKLIAHVREAGEISRLALSKKLKLAPSTIGIYVERLLSEGFLIEEKQKKPMKSGRPEVFLKLNPERGLFVGVDFYAEHILAQSVNFANEPIRQRIIQLDSEDGADVILEKIKSAIEAVNSTGFELQGIGVSVPGSIDLSAGVLIKYKWLPEITDLAIGDFLRTNFTVPVHFENTANLMALGEMTFGKERNLQNFINVTIRSGIGCGVIINGQIVAGENNLCGEIEYWRCPGEKIGGQLPELGELVSSSGILNRVKFRIKAGDVSCLDSNCGISEVIDAYISSDAVAVQVISEANETLAWTLSQLALTLAPQKFILSGDLVGLGESWLDSLKDKLAAFYEKLPMSAPVVEMSTLGKTSAALGAVAMSVQNWRLSREG